MIDQSLNNKILQAQQSEITEHLIYKKLARKTKDPENKKILETIAGEELSHYKFWQTITKKELKPKRGFLYFYYFIARIFGLNFTLKLMEKGEQFSQNNYEKLKFFGKEKIEKIIKEEITHEEKILRFLNQKELLYTSSVILGLNDALVELSGALVGLTLALQNPKAIAMVGIITGFAASLSMAGSEYLATREEKTKDPKRASFYTGLAYIFAVFFLILPYLIFKNPFYSLAIMAGIVFLIILVFTFYISTAKSLNFKKRFFEMATISLGVAIVNFFIGLLIRKIFKIDV
jgi:VIT1/CCC1 family predicted Fe2+/Mn2+ transporter